MVYTVSSTEKTNEKATEYETKALLYLMNFMPDSDEIQYFVIDFFNDLTGIDSLADKAWDVQSKGESNIYAKKTKKITKIILFVYIFTNSSFCISERYV